MNTYIIKYKQFPRERRGQYSIKVEATSRKEARNRFLRTVSFAREVQHLTPFIVDHITIVSIFEEAG